MSEPKHAQKAGAANKEPGTKRVRRPARYPTAIRVTVSIVSAVMILFSALMFAAGGYVWNKMNLIVTDDDLQGEYVDYLPPESDGVSTDGTFDPNEYNTSEVSQIPVHGNTKDVTNLLLLGIDGRTGYRGQRSDSMIILSINRSTKTIKLISLMRDTLVTIPGRDRDGDGQDDYAKLNSAHAYGGFDLLSKTIEQNFRLKIDQYIGANFVGFPIAIDALGGIDIELTEPETTQICADHQQQEVGSKGFQRIGTTAGVYHLNGYQALQYARIRHLAGDDFQRTARQRKVLDIVMTKARTMNFGQLNSILTDVLPETVTNMSYDTLLGYAINVPTYMSYTIQSDYRLPENGKYRSVSVPGVGSALQLSNPAEAISHLHEWIYG